MTRKTTENKDRDIAIEPEQQNLWKVARVVINTVAMRGDIITDNENNKIERKSGNEEDMIGCYYRIFSASVEDANQRRRNINHAALFEGEINQFRLISSQSNEV